MLTSPCNEDALTPHFYKVNRGIYYFLIFALKHRLWILVRAASLEPPQCTHGLCFEQKYEKYHKC